MPELAPVTRAFWPLRTLLIQGAGITASGRFSSRRCCCIRSSSCGDMGIRRLGGILISNVSFMVSISFWFNRCCVVLGLVGSSRESLQQFVARLTSSKRESAKRDELTIHQGWESRNFANDFARLSVGVERAIGRAAVRAGVIKIEHNDFLIHPLAVLDKTQAVHTGEPIGAGSDHGDERHQGEVALSGEDNRSAGARRD